MGSYVPAAAMQNIGVVDKIFTRVGASDNISMGESTFMVEMNETASILNNITERQFGAVGRNWARDDYLRWNFDCLGDCRILTRTPFARQSAFCDPLSRTERDAPLPLSASRTLMFLVKELKDKVLFS